MPHFKKYRGGRSDVPAKCTITGENHNQLGLSLLTIHTEHSYESQTDTLNARQKTHPDIGDNKRLIDRETGTKLRWPFNLTDD
jgi:hypothetical protein